MTEIKKEAGFGQCLKNVRGEPVLMKKCYVGNGVNYNFVRHVLASKSNCFDLKRE